MGYQRGHTKYLWAFSHGHASSGQALRWGQQSEGPVQRSADRLEATWAKAVVNLRWDKQTKWDQGSWAKVSIDSKSNVLRWYGQYIATVNQSTFWWECRLSLYVMVLVSVLCIIVFWLTPNVHLFTCVVFWNTKNMCIYIYKHSTTWRLFNLSGLLLA